MAAETATAKRVSRTLRASPVKEGSTSRTPIPREDIENLSAVTLAALGLPTQAAAGRVHAATPQASDRVHKRMSKTSSEMYATPPSTVVPASKSRTASSSSHVSAVNVNNSMQSSRTRDRTATSSSLASSNVSSPHSNAPQAPLTAIRRPAAQSHHQNQTPAGSRTASSTLSSAGAASRAVSGSMKASPSSLKLSTNGSGSAVRSRKASGSSNIAVSSSNRDTPTSIRSRAPSSDASRHLQRGEEQPVSSKEKGVFVTQEEYSSLVALLSAKDEQIAALKEQVDEGRKELSGLKERNSNLQKERDGLMSEKKELIKNKVYMHGAAGKEGSNSPQGEEAGITRREYESFKKQYEMQENLLEGFQRENEKATVELEALKKRDKHLTEQLKKIYGSTFSVDSEINPLTPEHGGISKRFPSSLMNNGHGPSSPLSNGMFIGEQHRRRSGLGLAQISARTSPLADGQDEGSLTRTEEEETAETGTIQERKVLNVEPAILMEQLLSVQSLLERFEKRLLVRESELIKKEREAAEQMEKLQLIVRE